MRLRDQSRAEWQGRAVIGSVPVSDKLMPTQQAALLIANLRAMEPELEAGAVVSLSPNAPAGSPAPAQVIVPRLFPVRS